MINNIPYLVSAPENSPNSFMHRGEKVTINDPEAYFSLYGFAHDSNVRIDELEDELKGANNELDEEVKNGKKLRSNLRDIHKNTRRSIVICQVESNKLSDGEYRDKLSDILDAVLSEIHDLT